MKARSRYCWIRRRHFEGVAGDQRPVASEGQSGHRLKPVLLAGHEAHRQECLWHRFVADADETNQEKSWRHTRGGVERWARSDGASAAGHEAQRGRNGALWNSRQEGLRGFQTKTRRFSQEDWEEPRPGTGVVVHGDTGCEDSGGVDKRARQGYRCSDGVVGARF